MHNVTSYIFLSITIVLFISITSCKDFQRFKYEKYTCKNNFLNVNEIYITKNKVDDIAQIFINGNPHKATIVDINDEKIILKMESMEFKLFRSSGEVKVLNQNDLHNLKCQKTVFTI